MIHLPFGLDDNNRIFLFLENPTTKKRKLVKGILDSENIYKTQILKWKAQNLYEFLGIPKSTDIKWPRTP